MHNHKKSFLSAQRWLPHPLMTLMLIIVWLLLVNAISFGHIMLGILFGVAIPWFTNRFWPERPKIAKPVQLVRFFLGTFLRDIIVANLNVVRLILQPDISRLQLGFIAVPLDIADQMVISILASVISLTPGTVSAEITLDRRVLIVHGLDIPDRKAAVRTIKTRYEAPLKEIFSC